MTERKVELPNKTTSSEGEQLLAECDDLLFDVGGSLAGLAMRGARNFDEAARSLLLITAQPLAHSGNGGLKQAGGGFDAALSSRLHQTQAMIVGVSHLANQDEVGGGHSGL